MSQRLLFVCMGNICRSPTAKGVFDRVLRDAGIEFESESAGTHDYHVGQAPDRRAVEAARKAGLDIAGDIARQFVREDFHRFDRIFAMDRANFEHILALRPGDAGRGRNWSWNWCPNMAWTRCRIRTTAGVPASSGSSTCSRPRPRSWRAISGADGEKRRTRSVRWPRVRAHAGRIARCLPDARCRGPGVVRRQGAQPQKTRIQLFRPARQGAAHRPHGFEDRGHRGQPHPHRNRSAAAGKRVDQVAGAALQHQPQGRQELSLDSPDQSPGVSPHRVLSRRAFAARRILRAILQRRGGARNAQPGLPAVRHPPVHRQRIRQPQPAVPAISDQALQRAVRGPYRQARLCARRRSRARVSEGRERSGARSFEQAHGGGQCGAGFRDRRPAARPDPGDPQDPVVPVRHRRGRRAGRDRAGRGGRCGRGTGRRVPGRAQRRRAYLLSVQRRSRCTGRAGDGAVSRPVLRRTPAADRDHRQPGARRCRSDRTGAGRTARAKDPNISPGARRAAPLARDGRDQRARCAQASARRTRPGRP